MELGDDRDLFSMDIEGDRRSKNGYYFRKRTVVLVVLVAVVIIVLVGVTSAFLGPGKRHSDHQAMGKNSLLSFTRS